MILLLFYSIVIIFVLYNLTVLIYGILNKKWREGYKCNKKKCNKKNCKCDKKKCNKKKCNKKNCKCNK